MARDIVGTGHGVVATRLGRVASVLALAAAFSLAVPNGRAASSEITIRDGGYDPATVTVVVGEPVTWTNASSGEHTVTSDDGTLDSGPISVGEAYGHLFEAPGAFAYHCTLHPDEMTGTIVVEAAPVTPTPSGSPVPTPPAGTLPPDFSPFPSTAPVATPLSSPTPKSTPAPSAAPSGGGGDSGLGGLLGTLLVVVVVGGIATYLVRALAGRRGRGTG